MGVEEFSTGADLVDTSVEEGLVESGLDGDGIVCDEEGVNIEFRGAEASPSSLTRSMGSSRLVMSISTMLMPKARALH